MLIALYSNAPMWGLTGLDWTPWTHATPPDLMATRALGLQAGDLIALLGQGGDDERGRYGVVARPRYVEAIESLAHLREALNHRRRGLRVVGLTYELGTSHLHARVAPRSPKAFIAHLDSGLIVDHRHKTKALWGNPHEDFSAPAALEHRGSSRQRAMVLPVTSDAHHGRCIAAILEHIGAGDIYQANLTRQMRVQSGQDFCGAELACLLQQHNPVPHAAYVRVGELEIISNSMETFLTYDPRSRQASSFPIKGTCRRDPTGLSDGGALRLVPKERAEHVMIVDLVRNDLGQVASPGSVRVVDLMRIEGYRGVWHGVSHIQAQLDPKATLADLIIALFPGGSITGAPKRRATEILAQLETTPRGYYTGCLGIIGPDDTTNMSILIRSLVGQSGSYSLGVGGGIVADSLAEREIEEMREKISVFREIL